MRRRTFLAGAALWPAAGAQTALAEPHFPSRLYQFVWRNWELANLDRMAQVARGPAARLDSLGRSMGLPPKPRLSGDQLRRIYITVIRQNWHLLPNEQLIELLGWTPERFAFTLKEDDFLDHKLGPKPACAPVLFAEPGAAETRRAAEMRRTLRSLLGRDPDFAGEPPFAFVERLSHPEDGPRATPKPAPDAPRFLYSYFALYGDPLLEPDIDPFPDGYLQKLARVGINGVWMQCVLRAMAPWKAFPEFGQGAAERLANLNRLIERAGRFGLKVYLYLNEPRAMPEEFFRARPEIKGASFGGLYAMCTTPPPVREWITGSVAHLFHEAPALGGVFSITMSENFTNCFSKFHPETCPRCGKRAGHDVVGEVLAAIHSGVRRSSAEAEVMVWDWGWPEEMARRLIPQLAPDSRLLSVSEWSIPLSRGGVKTEVGEYSMSVVGPGPRATAHWALARKAGLRTMAKTQFNNTWEISAVPYIPVANLVARHCENLRRSGVEGWMVSWTLGGYPSPNLEVAGGQALEQVAARRYGRAAAPLVLEAWRRFSEAFELYPYGVAVYTIPTQHGPANLLRAATTGVKSSMILFPQDDYKAWSGAYPPQVAQRQFARMADLWEQALPLFCKAAAAFPEDCAIAETCYLHFRSVANQLEYYILRDGPRDTARMQELVRGELELARRLYRLARRHSVIGYEASNHYFYRPLDLAEKILNCRQLLLQR